MIVYSPSRSPVEAPNETQHAGTERECRTGSRQLAAVALLHWCTVALGALVSRLRARQRTRRGGPLSTRARARASSSVPLAQWAQGFSGAINKKGLGDCRGVFKDGRSN